MLLIDRGSREQDVKNELQDICSLVKERGDYYFSNYAFLEVTPPYIEEGIRSCVRHGAEFITIIPYFLYPGTKSKLAVKQSTKIVSEMDFKYAITECLNYHLGFVDIVKDRIDEVKRKQSINLEDKECDVLLIGHGSTDRDARNAFIFIADSIRQNYRNVSFCFLELDTPNIEDGIKLSFANIPKVLIVMPYFLHRGTHIKHDVKEEVSKAVRNSNSCKVYMAEHLGVDHKIVEVLIELAREVEKNYGV